MFYPIAKCAGTPTANPALDKMAQLGQLHRSQYRLHLQPTYLWGKMMQNKPVGWFEIYVKDMHRAKTFYEAVFSMKLEKLEGPGPDKDIEMWSFPGPMDDGNGASGALVKMDRGPSNGKGVIIYFTSKDCATEAGRVSSNGGTVTKEKYPLGKFGFAALVTDTEGNVIGLHSMK